MLKEALRYFVAVLLGLCVDVGLAWALSHVPGVPLLFCAAIGFLAGVAANYVLFEMWVFATCRLTWARLGKAYLAAQGALLVRLVSVWLLALLLPPMLQRQLAVLVIAAGLSFTVNFALVRLMLRPR